MSWFKFVFLYEALQVLGTIAQTSRLVTDDFFSGSIASHRSLQNSAAEFQGKQVDLDHEGAPQQVEATFPLYGSIHDTAYWFADVFFGLPKPQRQSLIVDTGSSVTGFPCSNCGDKCGDHIDPPFDHLLSTSANPIKCVPGCLLCSRKSHDTGVPHSNQVSDTNETDGQCAYHIRYTEGSSLMGAWLTDKVWLNYDPHVKDSNLHATFYDTRVPFGCHSEETHLFVDQVASGILGLEMWSRYGPTPFVSAVLPHVLNISEEARSKFQSPVPADRSSLRQIFEEVPLHEPTNPLFAMCLSQEGGVLRIGRPNSELHLKTRSRAIPSQSTSQSPGSRTGITSEEADRNSGSSWSISPTPASTSRPSSTASGTSHYAKTPSGSFIQMSGGVSAGSPFVTLSPSDLVPTVTSSGTRTFTTKTIYLPGESPTSSSLNSIAGAVSSKASSFLSFLDRAWRRQTYEEQPPAFVEPNKSSRAAFRVAFPSDQQKTYGGLDFEVLSFSRSNSSEHAAKLTEILDAHARNVSQGFYESSSEIGWTPFVVSSPETHGSYLIHVVGWSMRGNAGETKLTLPEIPMPFFAKDPRPSRSSMLSRSLHRSPGLVSLVDSGTTLTYIPFLVYVEFWMALQRNVQTWQSPRLLLQREQDKGMTFEQHAGVPDGGGHIRSLEGVSLPDEIVMARMSGVTKRRLVEQLEKYIAIKERHSRSLGEQACTQGRVSGGCLRSLETDSDTKGSLTQAKVERDIAKARSLAKEVAQLKLVEVFPGSTKVAGEEFGDSTKVKSAVVRSLERRDPRSADLSARPRIGKGENRKLAPRLPVKIPNEKIDEECWALSGREGDFRYFPDMKLQFANGVEYVWRPRAYLYRKGDTRVYCLTIVGKSSEIDGRGADDDPFGDDDIEAEAAEVETIRQDANRHELYANSDWEEPDEEDIRRLSKKTGTQESASSRDRSLHELPRTIAERQLQDSPDSAVFGSSFFIYHDLIFHIGRWALGVVEAACPTTDLTARKSMVAHGESSGKASRQRQVSPRAI